MNLSRRALMAWATATVAASSLPVLPTKAKFVVYSEPHAVLAGLRSALLRAIERCVNPPVALNALGGIDKIASKKLEEADWKILAKLHEQFQSLTGETISS